jgi:integrase
MDTNQPGAFATQRTAPRMTQDADGNYVIVWAERIGTTGKWRSRAKSCRTKVREIADLVLRLETGQTAILPALTLDAVADLYLGARPSRSQGAALRAVRAALGGMPAAGITGAVVLDYRRQRVLQGAAGTTLRRELGALGACLRWAFKAGAISDTFMVPHVDLPPESQPRDVWLDDAQEARVWQAALALGPRHRHVRAFVCLALATGARKEAIEQLTWGRVYLERRMLDYRVPDALVSRKRRVPVPINDRLSPVLTELHDNPVDLSPYVMGERSCRGALTSFMRSLGLPWVTPHVLRHTAATLMLQRGASIWDVAGVLGDTTRTVERVYGHHVSGKLQSAVGRLV